MNQSPAQSSAPQLLAMMVQLLMVDVPSST
jgi:hypothetical protein